MPPTLTLTPHDETLTAVAGAPAALVLTTGSGPAAEVPDRSSVG